MYRTGKPYRRALPIVPSLPTLSPPLPYLPHPITSFLGGRGCHLPSFLDQTFWGGGLRVGSLEHAAFWDHEIQLSSTPVGLSIWNPAFWCPSWTLALFHPASSLGIAAFRANFSNHLSGHTSVLDIPQYQLSGQISEWVNSSQIMFSSCWDRTNWE